MSESKFTPGPWTTDGSEVMTEDYTTHIATAWSDTGVGRCVSRSEAIADARLIAAAPELLAALQELITLKDTKPHDYEQRKIQAWRAAREAIENAIGEA